MSKYKALGYKIIFLIILLVCFNYIYKLFFYEKDIQTHSKIINLVRDVVNCNAEIVYLGESSNTTYGVNDIDKRAISDFISDYYPSKKFGSITKEATHAGIYYELLKKIPEQSSVKTVVVTLNLRSFNATWIYSNLETPLQKSIVLLKDNPPLFNRFLLAFKGYDIKTEAEREKQFKDKWRNDILTFPQPFLYDNVIDWDRAMFKQGIKNDDGTINKPLTELASHYIKTYAFQIDTATNPRIKDFDNIVSLAKERHWNLVFNLMAENVECADSLVGKELVYLIKQNRDLLVNRYRKNDVLVVDNLECVHDSEYIDKNWTTEHYSEKGRKIIAKNVATSLKKIYPNDYVEVNYNQAKASEFFNNCEGNYPWGQMQTLTTENSYSGEKSSKTGGQYHYSITLEYPIKNLPDSLQQMDINMQIFQKGLNHDAKLIIEVSGKNITKQFSDVLITNLSRKTETWDEIHYRYELPKDFTKGDVFKVYVFNQTNTIIYIDDFKIKF